MYRSQYSCKNCHEWAIRGRKSGIVQVSLKLTEPDLLIASILSDIYILWSCCGDANAEEARGYSVSTALGASYWSRASQFRCTTPSRNFNWVDGVNSWLTRCCTSRQLYGHLFILWLGLRLSLRNSRLRCNLPTETTPGCTKRVQTFNFQCLGCPSNWTRKARSPMHSWPLEAHKSY